MYTELKEIVFTQVYELESKLDCIETEKALADRLVCEELSDKLSALIREIEAQLTHYYDILVNEDLVDDYIDWKKL